MPEAFVPIVGTHFRGSDAKRAVNDLTLGEDKFTFVREADNEYDSNAIQVHYHEDDEEPLFVGYLARANNHNLAALLDGGTTLQAKVIDFDARKPVLHITWA